MKKRQLSLFEGARLTLQGAIDLSLESLGTYGALYDHWAVAYSGGKDSSATVTFVLWAIKTGVYRLPGPSPCSMPIRAWNCHRCKTRQSA